LAKWARPMGVVGWGCGGCWLWGGSRGFDRLKAKACASNLGLPAFRKAQPLVALGRSGNFEKPFARLLTTHPPPTSPTKNEVLLQLATGSAENGELPRADDLLGAPKLANIDFR